MGFDPLRLPAPTRHMYAPLRGRSVDARVGLGALVQVIGTSVSPGR